MYTAGKPLLLAIQRGYTSSYYTKPMFRKLLLTCFFAILLLPSFGQAVRVAVAANAQYVVKKLAQDFKKKTGISVEVISGASGKLSIQIKNGAPYDIFLSADMDFADELDREGLTLEKTKVYAMGSLIVCSTTGAPVKDWKNIITKKRAGKIAIANPQLAPYGKAAEEALKKTGLYASASDRLVFAESVGQVNTYVLKGTVQMGFTTASLIYELQPIGKFKYAEIDRSLYAPIKQGAVLLKYAKSKNYRASKQFFDYLFSAGAKAIFLKFGYTTA